MDKEKIRNLFNKITVWKRGGQRASHKPLLILLALSQCIQNERRFLNFSEIDQKLKQILIEFGPTRKSYHPEYPFWRLQNDGLWELTNAGNVTTRKGNTDAKKSELIKYNVHGGFTKEMEIKVSDRAYGTQGFNDWLMAFHGKKLMKPQRRSYYPEPTFTDWHIREVFQGHYSTTATLGRVIL